MIDFNENIKNKSVDLIRKAKVLPSISIKWEEPIVIKCAELHTKEDYLPRIKIFMNHKANPSVYYFEIIGNHKGQEVVNELLKYKQKKERYCPEIDKKRNTESTFLYCGSAKNGLHNRLLQHLGFGSKTTYALQLVHWAKVISLEVIFHYAWLNKNHVEFTELIESALADKTKPLVGKIG